MFLLFFLAGVIFLIDLELKKISISEKSAAPISLSSEGFCFP